MPRGSKPGERRGGRKKGVPNKATVLAASVREAMMREGCDPVAVLAQVAMGKRRGKNVGHMVRAASELTQYLYAKLVRAEITGVAGGPIETTGQMRIELVYVDGDSSNGTDVQTEAA